MIKCKIKDPNSDKFFEVTVTADVNHLSEDIIADLQKETAELAKNFARHLGYYKIYEIGDDGVIGDQND